MTSEQIDHGQLRLTFSEAEADFIINTLARLGKHYQEDVAKMSPALRAYWQGTLSRGAVAKAELQESQEVLSEARHELRSERLELVESWIREYELAEQHDPWKVEISTSEWEEFVAMLNDRRMMLAHEMAITEADMEADLGQVKNEARRAAILEIDVLGHFILVMLGPQIHRP